VQLDVGGAFDLLILVGFGLFFGFDYVVDAFLTVCS